MTNSTKTSISGFYEMGKHIKDNFNFVGLSDTPSGFESGKYLISTVSGVEWVDAPSGSSDSSSSSGGIFSSSIDNATGFRGLTDFRGELPDAIVTNLRYQTDSSIKYSVVLPLVFSEPGGLFYGQDNNSFGGNINIKFNDDEQGTTNSSQVLNGSSSSYNIHPDDFSTSLSGYVSRGDALFYGSPSGNCSLSSLQYLKDIASSSANGGFYTELPDAILCDAVSYSSTYAAVFRLHWIRPAQTANGEWELVYRVENFGNSLEFSMQFLLDADGTNVTPSSDSANGPETNNTLRWFVENGRAVYDCKSSNNTSSSTFESLTNTPSGFESGKYLISTVSGVEWVDAPSGNASPSTFSGLYDTPNAYNSGKFLQSTDNGVEWVDIPAGASNNSSSSSCGIGINSRIQSSSNFHTNIPDQIIATNSSDDFVTYDFSYITDTQIGYTQTTNDSNEYIFDNNSNGSYNTNTESTHSGNSPSSSLSGFAIQDRVIYFGACGSSSSGCSALNSNSHIQEQNNFGSDLPIYLINGIQIARLYNVSPSSIWYNLSPTENTYIGFTNDADATLKSNGASSSAAFGSLREYIDSGNAIFDYGACGNNSSLDNASPSTFSGLSDTPNAYNSGKFLQSTADGIEWVDIPAGAGGSSSSGGIGNLDYIKNQTSFNGILPDAIMTIGPGPNHWYILMHLYDYKKDVGIFYKNPEAGFLFYDNSTGDIKTPSGTHTLPSGLDSIQKLIDNGHAIYYGGSSLSGGSSSSGGGGDSTSVNNDNFKDVWQSSTANSNAAEFYSILPDFIVIGEDHETETLYLHSISGPIANYFTYQYQSISPDVSNSNRKNVRFNTDLNGTLWNATTGDTNPQSFNASLLLGYASLKDFIDNGRAGYLGGGSSSSGGLGSSSYCSSGVTDWSGISDISNFYTGVPENIFIEHSNGYYSAQFQNLNSQGIVYSLNPTENKYLTFDNNAEGTFKGGNYTNVGSTQTWASNSGPSLSGLISAGHFHHGGGCSSSAGSGSQGSSTFSGLSDTPNAYNSGKFLQSTADGIEWVDIPAGAGGGSSSGGGVGASEKVLSYSKFGSTIPDAILLAATNNTPILFIFRHIDDGAIQFYEASGNVTRIRFNNDHTGTYADDSTAHTRYQGDVTLQDIIDNGNAIYFGGASSSGGGFGSLSVVKDNIDFYTTLPDAILVEFSDGSSAPLYLSHVNPTYYSYQSTEYESYAINFTDGTHPDATTSYGEGAGASSALVNAGLVGHSTTMNSSDRSLKYYIDNDRAIYYGGSSGNNSSSSNGSSTFAALTDTPTGFESGKYLISTVSGVEWVDAPSGNASPSTFSGLYDTPNAYNSGKFLQSTADGIEWVDIPAGAGGGSGGGSHEGANTAEIQVNQGLFEGVVPFAISALTSNGAGRKILYLDHYGAGETHDNQFIYSNHLDSKQFSVYFKTDTATGEWDGSQSITKEGDGSLASYIANGHAFYFGGGSSSSSGISDNIHIQSESQFAQDIPSYIIMAGGTANSTGTGGVGLCIYHFRQLNLNDNTLQYYDVYKGDDYVWFDNDSQGTFNEQSNPGGFYSFHTTSQQPSLKELCDSNYAGFSLGGGGGGGSSTFAALTDTPTELTADKYLKVNTEGTALELVDAPVGSGGGSHEGANTAEIQVNQGLFEGVVPFAISALTSNNAGRKILYLDHYGAGGGSEDYFLYSNHLDSARFAVYFKTDTATGEWLTSSTITKEGDGSLASYIANGHAFYFGGGTSSGGIGSNVDVLSDSNFSEIIPDEILVAQSSAGITKFQFRQIASSYIQYMDVYENNYIQFSNDSLGTSPIIANGVGNYALLDGATTLQDIIDNGHAIYIGGSSSSNGSSSNDSSTFASLTDTPTGFESGKYLISTVSGVEWVDAPSGNASPSTFSGLYDTPNAYNSGKFLQSTADGIEWVDIPAGAGGSSSSNGSSSSGGSPVSSREDIANHFSQNVPDWIVTKDRRILIASSFTKGCPDASFHLNIDPSTESVSDSSIYSHTISNNATINTESAINGELSLELTSSTSLSIPHHSSLLLNSPYNTSETNGATIELWHKHISKVNEGDLNRDAIISKGCMNAGGAGWSLYISNENKYTFIMNPNMGSITSSLQDNLNQWNHIVITRDNLSSLTKMYINGQLAGQADFVSLDETSYYELRLGGARSYDSVCASVGHRANCYIQDVRISNVNLYLNGPPVPTDIVGCDISTSPPSIVKYENPRSSAASLEEAIFQLDVSGSFVSAQNLNLGEGLNLLSHINNGDAGNFGSSSSSGDSSSSNGSSSSGGTLSVAEHPRIKEVSNFNGALPDVIFSLDTAGKAEMTPLYLRHIHEDDVFYSSIADACFISFNNDADGTPTANNTGNISRLTYGRSLRDFINDGNALFGGTSSSSDAIKTWCVFDGTGTNDTEMTIKAGANIASVLKVQDGVYKVTMTSPMPSEHYSVSVDCNPWGTNGAYGGVMDVYGNDVSRIPTAIEFHIDVRDTSNNNLSVNRVTFHVVC